MIDNPFHYLLLILLGLQIKHFVFDGPLQSHDMVLAKGHYGRPLGLLHAALHGLGTLVVMVLAGVAFWPSLLIAAFDLVLHYHIDFSKEAIVRRNAWTVKDKYFWWALSADQTLHQFTYLAIAWALIRIV
jgi:Protein of unknown function (DUF3307)